MGVLCLVLILLFSTLSFYCFNHLDGEERAGCFTLIMFKIPYDVYFKELSSVYTVLNVVTYVTYYHTNNKIIYTRIDVEYSLSPLEFQYNANIWCIKVFI